MKTLIAPLSIAVALGAMSSLKASAQELDCSDPQTQSAMNQCTFQSYKAADGDLNQAYKIARDFAKSLDEAYGKDEPKTSDLLRDAQRAWIIFRDKSCDAYSDIARGGSMRPLLHNGCLERLTRQRTEDLRLFGEQN